VTTQSERVDTPQSEEEAFAWYCQAILYKRAGVNFQGPLSVAVGWAMEQGEDGVHAAADVIAQRVVTWTRRWDQIIAHAEEKVRPGE
jgi:hypothetical protein